MKIQKQHVTSFSRESVVNGELVLKHNLGCQFLEALWFDPSGQLISVSREYDPCKSTAKIDMADISNCMLPSEQWSVTLPGM